MLLEFEIKEYSQKSKLFLHFDDEKTLHLWDLAIFINYKIISSLNKNRLFEKDSQTISRSENFRMPVSEADAED